VGIPRYLATATSNDLDRTLRLADELVERLPDRDRVGLVECGRPSPPARELATLLTRAGRTPVPVLVADRHMAQSDTALRRLWGVSSVWVFVENLFEAYMAVFATQLTFALRHAAREGLPVIGVGPGAAALGGLLVAQHVCAGTRYELVGGLGWAPRVLLDGGPIRTPTDGPIVRQAVRSLHGLLSIDVGEEGAVRVIGGRIESIGDEPIVVLGADEHGKVLSMQLPPGQLVNIAPPPFAPFTRDLISVRVRDTLTEEQRLASPLRQAPTPDVVPHEIEHDAEDDALSGAVCPMCNKVHPDARVELVA
jgi:hypothetical protein